MVARSSRRSALLATVVAALGVAGTGLLTRAQAEPRSGTFAVASPTTTGSPRGAAARARPAGAGLRVGPGAVASDGIITIAGTGCGTPGEARIVVGGVGGPIAEAHALSGPAGDWQVTVVLPHSFTPGSYPVRAGCLDAPGADRGFTYEPAAVAVTAVQGTDAPS